MRKPSRDRETKQAEELEAQRAARKAASRDQHLREQTKTEVEQRPYLDTEGGD
ncbi:MAG: hypothetical protein H0V17_06015 [Deltaproteobacteria bacterium]|nr:hypothetical protein [Deltaproteobacteria bacterium]